MTVAQDKTDLQEFLLILGADLGTSGPAGNGVDGKPGAITKREFLRIFANKSAAAITNDEFTKFAAMLDNASPAKVMAFAMTESGKSAFFDTGRPKILYERHYFWRRVRIKIPLLSNPVGGGYTMDSNRNGINDSWEKLADAICINPIAGLESCSWGKFQIMGAHWKPLGYSSVFEFAYSMVISEYNHYEAFVRFIKANNLIGKLKQISEDPETCRAIAKSYNGRTYYKHNYHGKIAENYRKAKAILGLNE
tara:strand:- start:32410 stop:33162 length:753 start_codon:yes stop_codon:yes gene_type:complete